MTGANPGGDVGRKRRRGRHGRNERAEPGGEREDGETDHGRGLRARHGRDKRAEPGGDKGRRMTADDKGGTGKGDGRRRISEDG